MEEIYTFAGNPLDRVSQRRQDAAWVASLLGDPETRLLPFRELKPVVRSQSAAALDWQPAASWREVIDGGATLVLLGIGEGRAYFALDASECRDRTAWTRRPPMSAASPPLNPRPARRRSSPRRARLLDWHARHGFCAQCGTPSDLSSGGWGRQCPNCRAHHYPRVDPVVIMLAVSGERCLLGRGRRRVGRAIHASRASWSRAKPSRRRCAAKSWRNSGIRVGRVRYLASQPWPFPSTLMMGLLAEALTEEIRIDPEELAEARWFERDEVRAMVERSRTDDPIPGRGTLPPPLAIGHQLARRWAFGVDSL